MPLSAGGWSLRGRATNHVDVTPSHQCTSAAMDSFALKLRHFHDLEVMQEMSRKATTLDFICDEGLI